MTMNTKVILEVKYDCPLQGDSKISWLQLTVFRHSFNKLLTLQAFVQICLVTKVKKSKSIKD